MSSINISGVTYNLGSSLRDYAQLRAYAGQPLDLSSREKEDAAVDTYEAHQKGTEAALANESHDFYLLQEVKSIDRAIITSLETTHKIIYFQTPEERSRATPRIFDCAIALKLSTFSDITDHSTRFDDGADVAIAQATHTLSGKKFTFTSLYAEGFNFVEPENESVAPGDAYCKAIAAKVSQIGAGTFQITGGDWNSSPNKHSPRFDSFTEQGHTLQRTNATTNVNPRDGARYPDLDQKPIVERELDYFFTTKQSRSLLERIKSFFFTTIQTSYTTDTHPIGLDPSKNASDHVPVVFKMTHGPVESKIWQLWQAFCKLCHIR